MTNSEPRASACQSGPEPTAGTAKSAGRVRPDRRTVGVLGEDAAAAFLAGQGLVVLDRNWRCREGEIDIVAATPSGTVVVVEVKTRTGTGFGMPVLAVTAAKYARLRRLAARWLTAHDAHARAVRIDVVAVLATPRGEICDIDHIAGAFR